MDVNSLSSAMSSDRLNSSLSDGSFRQSCETISKKSKSIDARTLNAILVHDDCEKAVIDDDKHLYFWYFAIGSMINPVSIFLRDLTPLVSYPARCPDYRLIFREPCGMADIEQSPGEEFHGVVHLLPKEQLIRLDQVEHMYQRITVNIIDYDQRSHLVYVYKMNFPHEESLPTERYLDIIVKGCEYFSVQSSYINRLKYDQPVLPRKSSAQFQTIDDVPEGIFFTKEDLLQHNGNDFRFPLWISINGKILEYVGLPSIDDLDYEKQKRFYDFLRTYFAGKEIAYAISRTWYEPMYKVPLNENDLCAEHRALAEDMCVSWGLNNSDDRDVSCWKPIGRLFSA